MTYKKQVQSTPNVDKRENSCKYCNTKHPTDSAQHMARNEVGMEGRITLSQCAN